MKMINGMDKRQRRQLNEKVENDRYPQAFHALSYPGYNSQGRALYGHGPTLLVCAPQGPWHAIQRTKLEKHDFLKGGLPHAEHGNIGIWPRDKFLGGNPIKPNQDPKIFGKIHPPRRRGKMIRSTEALHYFMDHGTEDIVCDVPEIDPDPERSAS